MRRYGLSLFTCAMFAAPLACGGGEIEGRDRPDSGVVERRDGGTSPDSGGGNRDAEPGLDGPPDSGNPRPDSGVDDSGMGRPDARPDGGIIDGGDFGDMRVPLTDMGTGTYKGMFIGGLYGAGENNIPEPHLSEGLSRAQAMEPLDNEGNPSAMGKYLLMSMGMSNTTMEFCDSDGTPPCRPYSFTGQSLADPNVNSTTLGIVNGALGNQVAANWDSPMDMNYERVRTTVLEPAGFSEAQVRIIWLKVANGTPSRALPDSNADAYTLLRNMGNIVRTQKMKYPNLTMTLLSSRIYAGYATTPLNPEPYAYEGGFAVKMLIEAQRKQMDDGTIDPIAGDLDYRTVAPWLAWAAYLWADGTNPRSDGLIWEQSDLAADGTHPANAGQEKVGTLLHDFFTTSPVTKCWFLANGQCP